MEAFTLALVMYLLLRAIRPGAAGRSSSSKPRPDPNQTWSERTGNVKRRKPE